jgi:hypothetical protein
MGHITHHAIVVTNTLRDDDMAAAHAEAVRLGCHPTDITPALVNGVRSFLIPPDGSKEFWTESDRGDARREEWKSWARRNADVCWVEIEYRNDDGSDDRVIDSSRKYPDAQ